MTDQKLKECSICYASDKNVMKLKNCMHTFHKKQCLHKYYKVNNISVQNQKCVICKKLLHKNDQLIINNNYRILHFLLFFLIFGFYLFIEIKDNDIRKSYVETSQFVNDPDLPLYWKIIRPRHPFDMRYIKIINIDVIIPYHIHIFKEKTFFIQKSINEDQFFEKIAKKNYKTILEKCIRYINDSSFEKNHSYYFFGYTFIINTNVQKK